MILEGVLDEGSVVHLSVTKSGILPVVVTENGVVKAWIIEGIGSEIEVEELTFPELRVSKECPVEGDIHKLASAEGDS